MMPQLITYFMKNVVRNPPEPLRVLVLMLTVLVYGASGFLYFELPGNPDLTWGDGFWYTIVTIATVGYGDFFPKTAGGRFLVGWPIMVVGIGLLGYALSLVAAALVTSKTREVRGMSSFNLKNHLVIFNFPGLGKIQRVLEELYLDPSFERHRQVVLIDEQLEELPPELQKQGVHFVRGNPARDETLSRAGLDNASHAIVLCRTPGDPVSDNLNVAITLAIEARCRSVQTVVECTDPASEELLRKAGSDRVVCTARFDSLFISQELLNPGVQGVIADLFSARGGQQIYFTQMTRPGTFRDLSDRCRSAGHLALGLQTADGIKLNVADGFSAAAGDQLVTIGASRLSGI
ncbi:MAG TPA: potassium channel family protein [Desulfuromonadales bacterium]|nr:potassium channel family protein [Desulfuromonadales bacterium]